MAEAAAKEPTMEDILSSIRKIIAEEENGKQLVETVISSDNTNLVSEDGNLSSAPVGSEFNDNTPKPIAVANPTTGSASKAPEQAKQSNDAYNAGSNSLGDFTLRPSQDPVQGNTLAEIAASIKADETQSSGVTLTPQDEPHQENETQWAEELAGNKPTAQVVKSGADKHSADLVAFKTSPRNSDRAEAPEGLEVVPNSRNETVSQNHNVSALMSPTQNNAVSDSFNLLKRKVHDELDSKTEVILRSMLKEWLDENLPNLVERLVREEIERVARGGHS
ncbi:MAG: DUF2497 domain-containing protein [Pseudomonadota bacterium]